MSASSHSPELTELLAQTRWVRALAGNLVEDPHAADDLAQDTCLVALDRPPRRADNLRGWLRSVMQNLLLQQARATTRRQRRELKSEIRSDGVSEATDDLVERAGAQRAVVDAVLSLSPPLRDTVLLRYFEQLMPRAVAQRMGVPVATVHSRLQRAHAQLRLSLDRNFGAGDGWRRALMPLPLLAPSLVPPAVLAMNMKVACVVAALALGSAVFWFAQSSDAHSENPAADSTAAVAVSSDTGAGQPAAAPSPAERVWAGPPPAVTQPAAAAPTRQCSGLLVDAEGRALRDVHVQLGDQRAATDAAGEFEIATAARGMLAVRADEPGWRTVLEGIVRAGDEPPPVLVVAAPAIRVTGHVRSGTGQAVPATVSAVLPGDLRSRLHTISDEASERTMSIRTGEDGDFVLEAAAVRGAELLVVAEGYLPHRRQLPASDAADLIVVLERLDSVAGSLQGQVVDPAGRAVADARIGLGSELARSDAQGNFVIADDGSAEALGASAAGYRRGLLDRPDGGFPPFVLLPLGPTPLSIRGRVVDETGQGIAGVVVWPNDPTVLCASAEPLAVEGIAAGCGTLGELRERFERGEFAGQQPQDVVRSTPTASWPWVSTGADGSFTLGGLEDRPYRLRAMDRDTLLMTQQDGVAAGSRGVRLVLDQSQLFGQVEGVVVAADGSPIPGVRVAVQIDTQRMQGNTMHGRAVATDTTDELGRFELARVPKAHAYFRLDGDDILPSEPGRNLAGGILDLSAGRPRELRLEVRVRMHVQVELLDPSRADAITVLDDQGEQVVLNVFMGNGRRSTNQLGLAEGRSPVFVVPDTARTLVLSKDGAEVGREVLQLRPGSVNTMRL